MKHLGGVSLFILCLPFISVESLTYYGPMMVFYSIVAASPEFLQRILPTRYSSRRYPIHTIRLVGLVLFLLTIAEVQFTRSLWTSCVLLVSIFGLFCFDGHKHAAWRSLSISASSGVMLLAAAQEASFFLLTWLPLCYLTLSNPTVQTSDSQSEKVWIYDVVMAVWLVLLFGGAWIYFGFHSIRPGIVEVSVGWPRHVVVAVWSCVPWLLVFPWHNRYGAPIRRASAVCFGLTLSFICLELTLRVGGPIGYGLPGDAIRSDVSDSLYQHNKSGFRDIEHPPNSKDQRIRIVTLGDSVTYGSGVAFDNIYPRLLEKSLNSESNGTAYEVFNFSHSGWNTGAELKALQTHGLNLAPDVVVLGFVLNDPEISGEIFQDKTLFPGRFDLALRWSYTHSLVRYIYNRSLEQAHGKQSYEEYLLSLFQPGHAGWERCKSDLKSISTLCREHDIELLVVIFPAICDFTKYPFTKAHSAVRDWVVESGGNTIDLLPSFQRYKPEELYVSFADGHPNALGHRLAAEAIVEWMGDRNKKSTIGQ